MYNCVDSDIRSAAVCNKHVVFPLELTYSCTPHKVVSWQTGLFEEENNPGRQWSANHRAIDSQEGLI